MKQGLTNYQKRKVRENLIQLFDQATLEEYRFGKNWYEEANNWCVFMAYKNGIEPKTMAGVVSALSPNNKWERNLIDARAVVAAWKEGLSPDSVKVCTYNQNKQKAFKVLSQGVEGVFPKDKSPKTHSFVRNVGSLDPERVTVDVWHWRASTMGMKSAKPKTLTTRRYRDIEQITKELAKERGLKGYEFQAIVWNVIRKS